eukprot:gene25075-10727_t
MVNSDTPTALGRYEGAPAFDNSGPNGLRTRLTFGLRGIAKSQGARKLVSTSSTLQNQLSHIALSECSQLSSGQSSPRPNPLLRVLRNVRSCPSTRSCPVSKSDATFLQDAIGSYTSQLSLVQSDSFCSLDDFSKSPTTSHRPMQRQAQVAWARMPYFISSSDPRAAESTAVSYLLYEAHHDGLEHAKEAEQQQHLSAAWVPYPPASSSVEHQSQRRGRWRWLAPWSWRKSSAKSTSLAVGSSVANTLASLPTQLELRPRDPAEQSLLETFEQLDVDRNGRIDAKGLGVAVARMGLPSSQEYIKEIMAEYDHDNDSTISFDKFKRSMKKREQVIQKAFRSMDADGDGEVTVSELLGFLRKAHVPVSSEQEAEQMMGLLDSDKNQTLSYPEFRRFACMLPASQASTTNHMLYAWANSSLWLQQDLTRAHQVSSPDEPSQRLFVGGISGVISRTIIAPIERLRTLMMLSKAPSGFAASCSRMWADGGFRGLWKGHMSTVIKVFPCSAIQFGVVDAVRKGLLKAKGPGGEISQLECFLAGCLAGGVACVVSHPLDTIRTQMTVAVGKTSMLRVARSIGMAGLYRGFNLSLLQEVLGSGIGFLAVDVGSQVYRRWNDGQAPSAQQRGLIAALGASIVMTCVMPLDVVVKRLQVQGCPGHPLLYSGPLHAFQTIAREEGFGAFYRGMLTTYAKTAPSMGAVYFFYDRISQILGIGGLNRYRMVAT